MTPLAGRLIRGLALISFSFPRPGLGQSAPTQGSVGTAPYALVSSRYAGREVWLYDFGPTATSAADLYRLPDSSLVFSSLPGMPSYTALRAVYEISWIGAPPAPLPRSHTQLLGLLQRGAARLTSTGRILNLPIVPAGSTLERDPEQRGLHQGWYEGTAVWFFDFGSARPRVMAAAPGSGMAPPAERASAGFRDNQDTVTSWPSPRRRALRGPVNQLPALATAR